MMLKGSFLYIVSLLISLINDIIVKTLTPGIPFYQVMFLRFFFSALIIFPFIGNRVFISCSKIYLSYAIRGVLLFTAMSLWISGIHYSSLASANLISLCIPLCTILLSYLFLNERLKPKQLFYCLCICFVYSIYISHGINKESITINFANILLLFSAISFSIMEVTNKKLIKLSDNLVTVFCVSAIVSIVSFPGVIFNWQAIDLSDFIKIFCLGINSSIIYWLLLKAYYYCRVSFLSSLKYIEFLFAVIADYLFYDLLPPTLVIILFIIATILNYLISLEENKS